MDREAAREVIRKAREMLERSRREFKPTDFGVEHDWDLPEPKVHYSEPVITENKDVDRPADWSAWDKWVDGRIQAALENFADMLGEEVGLAEKRANEKIRNLELTVVGLRAEIGRLREPTRVVDLPRRDTNAA
jgi:hypothetical protein